MELNFQLNINIKSNEDAEALLSLYTGLISIRKSNPLGSNLLNDMCNQIESNLKNLYSTEEWDLLQNQLGEFSDKARQIADNGTADLDKFTLDDE